MIHGGERVLGLIAADPWRMAALRDAARHGPPDGWLAAGFVRDAVWDDLFGRPPAPPRNDVDVIWFDRAAGRDADLAWERALTVTRPDIDWSVKNQARMHRYNNDPPYDDVGEALTRWAETASAVGVRLAPDGGLELLAPLGLDDLLEGVMRPTPCFSGERLPRYLARVTAKGWLERWPLRDRKSVV
jgi:hypothetical protein